MRTTLFFDDEGQPLRSTCWDALVAARGSLVVPCGEGYTGLFFEMYVLKLN